MKKLDSSLIGVLRKVDPSFEVIGDQFYTARNKDGFEVDIIRRAAKDADPHPPRMSDALQSHIVTDMVKEYLPHLLPSASNASAS